MTAPDTPQDLGNFGLTGPRLVIKPGTPMDALAFDVLCLVDQALAVFDVISEGSPHPLHYAGVYLLRQARIAVDHLQMTPAEGEAIGRVAGELTP